MPPFPTPCKGKSKSQPFAHTFALTGRRRLYTDTQGVALGSELAALSGRSPQPSPPSLCEQSELQCYRHNLRRERPERAASPQPRATPWVPCPHSLRPVRAKAKANRSPILLPLQGVGVYTLTPRALPWAVYLLPFQGARGEANPTSHTYFPTPSNKSSFCGRDSCDLRPRVALPSAASSATCGRKSMTSQ